MTDYFCAQCLAKRPEDCICPKPFPSKLREFLEEQEKKNDPQLSVD